MAQHHESAFETAICQYLAAHGWLYSPTDAGYDRELALFPEDVFGWLADTQPDELAKRVNPDLTGQELAKAQAGVLRTLTKQLDANPTANGGTLAVLRRGFKDLNAQFKMCEFKPNTTRNATTAARYAAVRLRVMRQVHYSTRNNNSIDLVLFVNGLPVATIELKTDFTQSITDAVLQYKNDRLPKGEPLLGFASRALVHFAVSSTEVQMTTKLAGKDTYFLPFNRGNNGHAGNPTNPEGSDTAYLWETILQRDTWLEIIQRFLHLEVATTVDPVTSKKTTTRTLLFPRFHQWEAVTAMVNAVREEGPGHRYLIQHSAGSGKTNSISWLAHRLSVLHNTEDAPVFDAVVVITDRNILDAQLQEAIHQIDRTPGTVAHIDGLGGSKSQALADALADGTKIIIVTIQTFPFALELIRSSASLAGKSFAVIADEAHSSQTGEASKRLKSALSDSEAADLADGGTFDVEDVLAADMTARAESKNLSFFAFTATPKSKTLELFGRKGADGTPQPFHLYSMQQAIEEKFILDVLQNYTPYKTAFRLTHNGQTYDTDTSKTGGTIAITGGADDGTAGLVDKSAAVKSVMNWVRLHPTNISQKVGIIVEHYRANVAPLLGNKAKAMVVTSSRKAAVRYKVAFDKYVNECGYTDVAALVAFSGDITDLESGVEKATESSMNPGLKGRGLRDAFNTGDYQVMLVANKFQTGFDQPLLVAMYVDKKLSGVAAVQTLSRLNRRATGKTKTFVLDFANTAEDIVEAFEPYYAATTLADVTDPNIVHETAAKLDAAAIYRDAEIDNLVQDFLGNKGHEKLVKWVSPARDRFRDRERTAAENSDVAALETLDLFRKDVGTFLRQYDFLSQIFDYEDTSLEKLSIYLRYLAPQITRQQLQHAIDLSAVAIDYIAQNEQGTTSGKLTGDAQLEPATAAGSGSVKDPEWAALEEIIEQINDLFSGEHPDASVRNVVTHVRDRLEQSETLQEQAKSNTLAQFSASPDLHNEFLTAVIGAMESSADLSAQILNNQDLAQKLLGELLPTVYRQLKSTAGGTRFDIVRPGGVDVEIDTQVDSTSPSQS